MVDLFEEHHIPGGICADEPFWRALAAGQFRLPACAQCATWTWPAHFRCGKCGSWAFNWQDVEPQGVIFSWTRTWHPFVNELRDRIPYVTAVVELPQAGGARVIGLFEGSEEGLAIGAAVVGRIAPAEPASRNYPSIRWSLSH